MSKLMTLPIPQKCQERTVYPVQKGDLSKKYVTRTCVYLTKEGKCELNACVKNLKGGDTDAT